MAFFDVLIKLAATGALFGILVLLLRISDHLSDISSGNSAIAVYVRQRSEPLSVSINTDSGLGMRGTTNYPYVISVRDY